MAPTRSFRSRQSPLPSPPYSAKTYEFASDCVGDVADKAVANLPDGGVLLLENTRFYKGDEKNDPEFAQKLAKHGDVFVNDAFGSAHRAHASTEGVTTIPARCIRFPDGKRNRLSFDHFESPKRPFIAILGGAKVSDKIEVIESLLGKVDHLLIGGGMANTFFQSSRSCAG